MDDLNIKWYEDKNLAIFFNTMPCVAVRYITPSMTDVEKQAVKRFPFICKKELKVELVDKGKNKVYSIPRAFWRLIGSNTDNAFLIPALIHDVLCENHGFIDNDRSFSTNVFNALLYAGDVGKYKRFMMKNSVGLFQTVFCKWGKKK